MLEVDEDTRYEHEAGIRTAQVGWLSVSQDRKATTDQSREKLPLFVLSGNPGNMIAREMQRS